MKKKKNFNHFFKKLFADEGLRTLLLGQVEISKDDWENLSEEMSKARRIIDKETSKNALAKVAEKIEKNLELVGATALEDKVKSFHPKFHEIVTTRSS